MYIQNVRYNYAEPNPDPKSIKAVEKIETKKKKHRNRSIKKAQ